MNQFKLTAIAASMASLVATSNQTLAEVTANLGVISQYHFRGIQQTTGASTSAGLDYEQNSVSLGAWAADVNDGLEIDLYGSYAFKLEGGVMLSAGATTYQYTGDFDSAYNEINLGAHFDKFSVGYNFGQWDGTVGNENATEADYSVLTLGYEHNGFSGEIGIYGNDFDGEYFDIAYSTKISEFNVSIGLVISGSDLNDDESLYFSLGKTFDVR